MPSVADQHPTLRPRRLFVACLLTWCFPYLIFSAFVTFAELQAPYSSLPVLHPLVVLYVMTCGLLAAGWITHRYRRLADLDGGGAPPAQTLRGVRRTLLTLPLLVLTYLAVGSVGTLMLDPDGALLAVSGLQRWDGVDLLVATAGVGIICGYILLPFGLVCLDEFGRTFGHLLEESALVPMWLRSTHGLVLVVLVGAAMVLQEYIRIGRFETAPLVLVVTMIPYAIVVMVLNMRYTASAVKSVERYVAAARSGRSAAGVAMRSESLDEVGVLVRDVGELVRKLEASEARLRDFADAASDYYFESDADWRITWLSARSEAVTGRPQEEVLGLSFAELADHLSVDVPRETVDRLAHNEAFRDLHVAIRGTDDVVRRLRLSGVPVHDAEGRFAGYRGVGTDVSDMADAEARLRDREAQLAQAQKMEAVGQLTGGVAHDFNNLLLVVAGNVELALEEADVVERRALLGAAMEAAQRGAGLVQHLLAFSRRQVLRPEVIDLPERFEGLRQLLRTSLGERVQLRVELGSALRRLHIDPVQFESAILNLALNARDAMPDGGELTIRATNRRLVGSEQDLPAGDYVEVSVEDTGQGMSAAVRERVFEPFFSTKAFGAGSGLGLSMVYGFVSQSRGAVEVRSAEGVGTTIRMLLPASEREPVAAARPAPPVDRRERGERILMVEDEAEVRRALSAGLEAAGYLVEAVGDADAGRELIDAGLRIDLLLTDVVLPGVRSGVDLVTELRRLQPSLPCLLMSGYTDDALTDAPTEVAGVKLLAKPFSVKSLVAEVDALLEARRDTRAAGRPRLVSGS